MSCPICEVVTLALSSHEQPLLAIDDVGERCAAAAALAAAHTVVMMAAAENARGALQNATTTCERHAEMVLSAVRRMARAERIAKADA